MKKVLLCLALFTSGCYVVPVHRRVVEVGPYPESAIEHRYDRNDYVLVPARGAVTYHQPATAPAKPVRHYPTYEDIRWEQEHEIHVWRVR